jgi:Zn-dependent protease
MGGRRYKVATIRGIPLYVSASWVFIVALFVWSNYINLTENAGVTAGEAAALSTLTSGLFFGSILMHEAAHAVMARALKLQVTGITLVFWGGATETRTSGRGPLGEFMVAFVGPATTLLLATIFWGVSHQIHGVARDSIRYLAFISFLFAGLNALPGFPLDGGRMLLAATWGITNNRRTALRFAGYVGMLVGGLFVAYVVLNLNKLPMSVVFFLGYIGVIMIATGRGMDTRVAFLAKLHAGRVADAMRPPPAAVPADISLSQALDHFLRGTAGESFPVVDAGRVVGTVSLVSARRAGSRDPMRPVREGMLPLSQTPSFSPEDTLDEAVEGLFGRDGLVLRDGELLGAIGGRDIELWFRRVVEGRFDPDPGSGAEGAGATPPRPDL